MRFRWMIILIALLLSVYMLVRPAEEGGEWHLSNAKENIKLGLDLQGGIYLQLEVDEQDAVNHFLEEQAGALKSGLEGDNFVVSSSEADLADVSVTLRNVSSQEFDNILKELRFRYDGRWSIRQAGGDFIFRLREVARQEVKDDSVRQTVYKIQNRVDELGVTEPVINRIGSSNRIVVELAGADDSQRVHAIVKEPGKLEWRMVLPGSRYDALTEQELLAAHGGKAPPGTRVFPSINSQTGQTTYMLLKEVLLTARNVSSVFNTRDDRGLPAVGVTLDRVGGQIFNKETGQNVGNLLAIVLDGKIISAPRIQSQLTERFSITGQFSPSEVQDMVVKIKSGSLPAEVRILEERTIGPTLGRDAIYQGSFAAIIGLLIVILFILLYYRVAGLFANLALVMNLFLILGMLSGIDAVLTLPGIAGFILTIGMAVDANVLVYERIREELRAGTPPKKAVDIGYRMAYVTILDANITTFIAAFCLYLKGQGPIKGFAMMLMIGIVASIFTAVFCSRTFFLTYLKNKTNLQTLSIWPVWSGNRQVNSSH